MTNLLPLAMALALAVISTVGGHPTASAAFEQTSPAALGGPTVVIAQVSLPDLSDLPTRFGGADGGMLGHR
jgi:hypothetical protein